MAILGAILSKLVGMGVDVMFDRLHERQQSPLTQKQIRRRLAARLLVAAASCALYVWFALILFDLAIATSNKVAGAIAALLVLGAAFFARSARRRWVAIKTSRFVEDQMARPLRHH